MIVYFLLAIVLCIAYLYIFKSDKLDYWTQYNIPFCKGRFGLGFFGDFFTGSRPLYIIGNEIYKKYPDASAIVLGSLQPQIFMKLPEDIQHVLAGDFNSFNHRGLDVNWDVDLLADSVLFMNGPRWKLTRQKMTPLFTSAKLRNMYYIMNRSAQDFVAYLKKNNKKENGFDTLCTFCAAAISASVFGISNNKSTMDSPFLDMARKVFTPKISSNFKFIIANLSPKLFAMFKITLFKEYEAFFIGSIIKVLKARKESNVKAHDFVSLCVEVQNNGTMKDPSTGFELEPTDELMSAQAFFFYIAGVEPAATAMFFTLYELAKNPKILEKVHEEIDSIFEKNNGEISHEDIVNMEYLERVIDEGMRIHPPIGILRRKCVQDSVLPGSQIKMKKNVSVIISVYSIHHDPKYYPDPDVFDPDRFTAEAKQARPNYTYMPFGDGNRICLGMRYARLQVKTGLVHLLRHFTVKTENMDVDYMKTTVLLRPGKMDFQFVERVIT